MELTPGLRYVGRWTVSTALPVVGLFFLLVKFFRVFAGVSLSVGGSIAFFPVTLLAILAASIISAEVSQRRRAAALGARLAPRIRGYLPGNADLLLDTIKRADTDYIGNCTSIPILIHTNEGRLLVMYHQAPLYWIKSDSTAPS